MQPLTPIAHPDQLAAVEQTPLEERLPPRATYELIADAAEAHADLTAIRFLLTADPEEEGYCLTYQDFLDQITRFANLLKTLGLTSRDCVAILLPNLPQTHIALWGAEAAGVACMVNPLLEPAQLEAILRAAEARVLVTLAPAPKTDIWSKVAAILPRLSGLRAVYTVDPTQYVGGFKGWVAGRMAGRIKLPKHLKHQDFDEALADHAGGRLTSERRISDTTPAAYFHTGGTTGTPKLATHTHMNQVYMAWSLAGLAGLTHQDRVLCGLPLFHVNGAMVTGLAPFSQGAEVVLAGAQGYRTPGLIDNFWALIAKHRITSFSGVPTLYASLLERARSDQDVSSLRYVICGAAPMPKELFKRFEDETGLIILEGYGLTEGTCASCTNPLLGQRKIGSVGLRHPYQELQIARRIDADEGTFEPAAPGEIGHLLVRGPNVFLGYRQSTANRGVLLNNGWLNTGDLAQIDDEGYVWLKGRAKDVIIRGGHNIDPAVIEDALAQHPDVALAAAVGQPDFHAGELPAAFVTLKPGARAGVGELMEHARKTIPERAAIPVHLAVMDDLPVTAVGKIFKPPLRAEAARRVVDDMLDQAGLRGEVQVTPSAGGLQVKIKAPSAAQATRAKEVLAGLALDVTVVV